VSIHAENSAGRRAGPHGINDCDPLEALPCFEERRCLSIVFENFDTIDGAGLQPPGDDQSDAIILA
jgi:hypothetical protein